MRKLCFILLCLALGLAASAETPRPILCSVYEQQGWGDRVTISFIDEDGGLWAAEGSASKLGWKGSLEDKALRMTGLDGLRRVGEVSFDDVFSIKSLIESVEDQGRSLHAGTTLDYGIVYEYAVRYDQDDAPECVLLNACGDDAFANSDANAQGLRLWLVKAFAQGEALETDQILSALGIVPTPMSEFCGYDAFAIAGAEVTATLMDCEEGPIPAEISGKEADALRQLAEHGSVIAKANATEVTGNIYAIRFADAAGNEVASFDLYHGLLVRRDGMYFVDVIN